MVVLLENGQILRRSRKMASTAPLLNELQTTVP